MSNTPNTPDKPLTERQQQILDHINDYWRQHSRPPSVRDICDVSGISSPNGVHSHLMALIQKGQLLPIPASGMSRSIIPLWVVKAIKDAPKERQAGNE